MIKSFKSRKLKKLFQQDDSRGLPRNHAKKLRNILDVLDACAGPSGVDLPGARLHRLQGKLRGHYAVEVTGNWRVTFRFEGDHVVDVDFVDYY